MEMMWTVGGRLGAVTLQLAQMCSQVSQTDQILCHPRYFILAQGPTQIAAMSKT